MNIHGMEINPEQGSESAEKAAEYLSKHPDEAKAYCDEARNSSSSGYECHFETPNAGNDSLTHHLTLVYKGDGTYHLRKRTGY